MLSLDRAVYLKSIVPSDGGVAASAGERSGMLTRFLSVTLWQGCIVISGIY